MSVALMRLTCVIDAPTWPVAAQTLVNKMAAVVPAHPYEVVRLTCEPTPDQQGNPREVGPPWRFLIEVQLTTMI